LSPFPTLDALLRGNEMARSLKLVMPVKAGIQVMLATIV
jgi:hypothetical protein